MSEQTNDGGQDLHARIMNLPAGIPPVPPLFRLPSSVEVSWSEGYKYGHRDARHAAAELAAEHGHALSLARSALEEREQRIRELEEALRSLLWYAGQLEMIVYASDDTGEHEEMAKARSVLNKENGNTPYDEGPFTIADDRPTPAREDDGDNAWFHDADMGDR